MKNRFFRKLFPLFLFPIVLAGSSLPVYALDDSQTTVDTDSSSADSSASSLVAQPEPQERGSLRLVLHDPENGPVQGGSLEFIQVASVDMFGIGLQEFTYLDAFSEETMPLENLDQETPAKELDRFATAHQISGTIVPMQNGVARKEDLPVGLYLIRQAENFPGYPAITPVLISIPYADDAGRLHYDVDALPKILVIQNAPDDDSSQTTSNQNTSDTSSSSSSKSTGSSGSSSGTSDSKSKSSSRSSNSKSQNKPSSNSNNRPNTGVSEHVMLYSGLFLIAALGTAGITMRLRKEKEHSAKDA